MMNIFASENDTVRFLNKNGTDWDQKNATKYLKEGDILTVHRINVYDSSSEVEFKEYPRMMFNPVMFEDVNVDEDRARENACVWYNTHS